MLLFQVKRNGFHDQGELSLTMLRFGYADGGNAIQLHLASLLTASKAKKESIPWRK